VHRGPARLDFRRTTGKVAALARLPSARSVAPTSLWLASDDDEPVVLEASAHRGPARLDCSRTTRRAGATSVSTYGRMSVASARCRVTDICP
jgi:hypothetical protein